MYSKQCSHGAPMVTNIAIFPFHDEHSRCRMAWRRYCMYARTWYQRLVRELPTSLCVYVPITQSLHEGRRGEEVGSERSGCRSLENFVPTRGFHGNGSKAGQHKDFIKPNPLQLRWDRLKPSANTITQHENGAC